MDFLSLSEELEGIDRHLITFHSEACIHATRRFAECALCHTVCPVDAILPNENLPIFDQNKCVKCKACMPVCPMGAFQATDSVLNLLKCVSRFKPHSIEIVCEKHSASEEAVPNSEVAFQIQGCLAGLGSGAYIALFALGVESVIARTDLCKTCEWGALRTHIDSQIEDARTFLGAWEWEGKLSSISELPENNDHERPVWNTENLPVSRRDLFRLSSQQSDFTLARELAGDLKEKQHHPSLNRTRLIASLGILIQSNPPVQDIHLENMGFAKITVDETCTACGACARICPTKALNLESDTKNKTYRLSFTPELCINCGVCLHACMPHSITLESNPTFQYVFENKEPITLRDGSLTRCEGCKVWFASHLGEELCPGCAYRKENLYGSMIPRDWQPGTMGPYKPDKPSKEQAPSGSDT